ncbi:hypothetical protein [Burkholderia cenocepacia]|uniref:hypothetical protein n=1 Tax=Burkholderia cenocepacia TaxID=95486 RepID=UPI002AB5F9C6|nr:hypothetical protein [Burkholderia cenocepacia]
MSEGKSPQGRIAAARRLYVVLRNCLDRPTWTPIEGALIVSGMNAPAGCAEFPSSGTGLDGRPFTGDVIDRLFGARDIMKQWQWRCDDDVENGVASPTTLTPYEFIAWCQDTGIESAWLRLFFEVISGDKMQPTRPDLIPLAVAEYAAQVAETLNAVQALVGQVQGATPSGPAQSKADASRGPTPIPDNRDHVSTEELAAILAIDPQSIRKRYSQTGSYLGVRPTKLPNRRLLWPVADVRALLGQADADD